jgi:hypothetical protein
VSDNPSAVTPLDINHMPVIRHVHIVRSDVRELSVLRLREDVQTLTL